MDPIMNAFTTLLAASLALLGVAVATEDMEYSYAKGKACPANQVHVHVHAVRQVNARSNNGRHECERETPASKVDPKSIGVVWLKVGFDANKLEISATVHVIQETEAGSGKITYKSPPENVQPHGVFMLPVITAACGNKKNPSDVEREWIALQVIKKANA